MVTPLSVEKPFLEPHGRLSEAPIYDKRNNILAHVDIIGKKIHWYDYTAADVEASHKWVSTNSCPGVIGLTSTPLKYIAAVELGFAVIDLTQAAGNGELVNVEYLHKIHSESDKLRFNDGIVDAKGRFYAGSMFAFHEEPHQNGIIYRYESDGTCHPVVKGVGIPNGFGFSPDNKHMYTTDSFIGKVYKWDYDLETAAMTNQRVIIDLASDAQPRVDPDGMSVSTDGSLWIALWEASKVVQYSSEGEPLLEISVPARRPSCTAFAGPNLSDLILTTASLYVKDDSYVWKPEEDKGGEVFKLDQGTGCQGMDRNVFPLN